MLYLNSIENAEASPTEKKYAICHDEVPSMRNIPGLAPSKALLAQWQSQKISWEIFRNQFMEEMRTEYLRNESRLKRLAKYGLENDVTLHSPEPSGEQTYRTILEGVINAILESEGRTDRVTNLAREPVEESQLQVQEDITSLFRDTLRELSLTKDDKTRLLRENDELKRQIDQLEGETNTHTESIKLLDERISNKDEQIQSLQAESHNKDRENAELKTQIDQLQREINTHTESIGTKNDEIKSLKAAIRNKDGENDELKTQIAQLQEINTHPGIRDIAVEATGDNLVFGEYFRDLNIDENLPEILRNWLIRQLRTDPNSREGLPILIREYQGFGEFDKYDVQLAHAIRTQRELIAYRGQEIDERTRMGRALCCFFAAALLSPKLPEPKQPAFK